MNDKLSSSKMFYEYIDNFYCQPNLLTVCAYEFDISHFNRMNMQNKESLFFQNKFLSKRTSNVNIVNIFPYAKNIWEVMDRDELYIQF